MSDRPRTILFGLRTNVQFFASHVGFAALATRLKIFSLLYDQIALERGVYEGTVGENGAFETVQPDPRPEQMRPLRTRRGTPWGLAMQREGGVGPATTVISTRLEKRYRSQFYSAIQGASKAKVDWMLGVDFLPGSPQYQIDDEADELYRRWDWDERELSARLFPEMSRYLRNKAHQNLNRDLARAVVLGFALAPDGIHMPFLEAKVQHSADVKMEPSGAAALTLLLPDIRAASWEDIVEIRKDKGLRYFRDQVRGLEASAGSQPLLDHAVREALVKEVNERLPNWGSTAVSAVINVLAGAIAPLGVLVTGVAAGRDVASTWKERRGWTATLLRARRRLAKRRRTSRSGPGS